MKSVYDFDDYRAYLRAQISAHSESWGLITRLANAAECQRSHLSRVVSEKVHLTLEQANGLAEFWELSEVENEFFLTLVEHGRAGTVQLRTRLARKMKRIRQEQTDLSKRLSHPSLTESAKETLYYSAWYWSAIHILVSIPEFQTIDAISARLEISKSLVQHCLKTLSTWGLVTQQRDRWTFSSQTIHLSRQSPSIGTHHGNWRTRAVLDAQIPGATGLHYTVVQSLSRSDYEKVKQLFLKSIEDYQAVAGPSQEEELICVSCDIFSV